MSMQLRSPGQKKTNVDTEFMLAVCLLNQWYFTSIDKVKMV